MDTKVLDKIAERYRELIGSLPMPREVPSPEEFRSWVMDLITDELQFIPPIVPAAQLYNIMCTILYWGFVLGSVYTHQRGLPQFVIPFLTEDLENPGEEDDH